MRLSEQDAPEQPPIRSIAGLAVTWVLVQSRCREARMELYVLLGTIAAVYSAVR